MSNLPTEALSAEVLIGLGGNLGDPLAAMREALRRLDADEHCKLVSGSSVWRTPPWGLTDQPDFLNACAKLTTSLSPRSFLELCLKIEQDLKRVRDVRWGPRSIDIDILFFGDQMISEPGLMVPHPRIAERAFVLVPLAEIAGERNINGRTLAQLAFASDQTGMKKLEDKGWHKLPADED
ncbi:MAG: 2-amino-4-hydroxy-6-hydroxymethyldihydropteridine diphosphokinase [Rhizobiaceae bacterium]